MYQFFKIIRKVIGILLVALLTSVLATSIYFYHYRNQILARVINELSKKTVYPIQVKKVGLTIFDNFPKLSIVLHECVIQNPTHKTDPWLKAHKVYGAFDLRAFLQGQYVIDQLSFEQGYVIWKADQLNPFSLHQTRVEKSTDKQYEQLKLSLNALKLKDMQLTYTNQQHTQDYGLEVEDIQAELHWQADELHMFWKGTALLKTNQAAKTSEQKKLALRMKTKLSYHLKNQVLTIYSSEVQQEQGRLFVEGNWTTHANGLVDIKAVAKKINIHALWASVPIADKLADYVASVQGSLDFNLHGYRKSGKHNPLSIQGTLALPASQFSLKCLANNPVVKLESVQGRLNIPNCKDLTTASLQLEQHASSLGEHRLVSECKIRNFKAGYLTYKSQIKLHVTSLLESFNGTELKKANGWLIGNAQLEAQLNQLFKQIPIHEAFHLKAKLHPQDVCFTYGQMPYQLANHSSSLHLDEEKLTINNLIGKVGASDFTLQGTLKNLSRYWLSKQGPLVFAAKLYADDLDLNALLPAQETHEQETVDFTIAPYWQGELMTDIQALAYKHFKCKHLQGKFIIQEQKILGHDIKLNFAGGKAVYNGFMDTHPDQLHFYSLIKLQQVHLDKLFASFNNFQQDFLKAEHLGGQVFADLTLDMYANKQGHVDWDRLKADMMVQLQEGILRNFEPLQKLADYVAEKDLACLRFGALKNRIQIHDRTVYIPLMDIYSHITRIQLSGTHTFDGKLAYQLLIPWASFKDKIFPQSLDHNNEDSLAGLNLHLKLQGNNKNYHITYDKEALKADLKANLSKQKQALKEIFKGEYSNKQKSKELAPNEYFDFD